MAEVVLDNIDKSYDRAHVVRQVNLTVKAGEFLTLLGPSGCGKTTCLRMVAGFVTPTSGRILMGARDVTGVPAHKRNTGMVFQSYALFPHQTVAANIAFGLKVRRLPRSDVESRVREVLRLVQLEHLADRYPRQLSGGQRQRVALARAVVIRPEVLLLDEPLAALDLKLREELQVEIKQVQRALNITTLFVTHDQGEALGMSDRVAVMREGQIVQIDSPKQLYDRPNSIYVANFVGRTNMVPASVVAQSGTATYKVRTPAGVEMDVPAVETFQPGEYCIVGARPEKFTLKGGAACGIDASVTSVVYRGSTWTVEMDGAQVRNLTAYVASGEPLPKVGEQVTIGWNPADCFLLKSEPAAA